MSGSILKEVTFTPQAFGKDFNLSINRRFGKLISILESLIESGIILAASPLWKQNIYELLEDYEDNDKSDLSALLKELDSRERIVIYPNSKQLDNEKSWISEIAYLNKKRAFDFVAGTINDNIVNTVESIDRKKYLNIGAKVTLQTKDNMHKMLAPMLSYAEIVKIIDPYFHFESYDKRYEKAFEVICTNLGNNHDIKNGAIIDIHTSIKPMINTDKEFEWQKADQWPQIIDSFEKKYGHKIILYIWEEVRKKNEWHDRWIITNQCGISIGKGSDVSNWTDSTWGLLDWEELPEISNKFDSNRQVYNFIGKINSTTIVKNQNPKNTFTYLTEEEQAVKSERLKKEAELAEEERLKKNKEPKKLKRRLVPLRERGK